MPADRSSAAPNGLEQLGIRNAGNIFANFGAERLIEHSIRRQEGALAGDGALVVPPGQFTGRSPQDKFIVRDDLTESSVNWGPVNQAISPEHFERIYSKVTSF